MTRAILAGVSRAPKAASSWQFGRRATSSHALQLIRVYEHTAIRERCWRFHECRGVERDVTAQEPPGREESRRRERPLRGADRSPKTRLLDDAGEQRVPPRRARRGRLYGNCLKELRRSERTDFLQPTRHEPNAHGTRPLPAVGRELHRELGARAVGLGRADWVHGRKLARGVAGASGRPTAAGADRCRSRPLLAGRAMTELRDPYPSAASWAMVGG